MSESNRYSPEVRGRAVRMRVEHKAEYDSEWPAMESIASKIDCPAETLRKWVRCAEVDAGERERLKALEKENRELKRANGLLKTASAFFA